MFQKAATIVLVVVLTPIIKVAEWLDDRHMDWEDGQ